MKQPGMYRNPRQAVRGVGTALLAIAAAFGLPALAAWALLR